MSICRWSSDSFRSDMYIYEADDGYVIHLAAVRHTLPPEDEAPPLSMILDDPEEHLRLHEAFMGRMRDAERVVIGLPHDGETFYGLEEDEMWAKVVELAEMGYHCPAAVLEEARSHE